MNTWTLWTVESGHIYVNIGADVCLDGSHWDGTNWTAKWASNIGLDGGQDNGLWNFPMEIVSVWKQFVSPAASAHPTILLSPTFTRLKPHKNLSHSSKLEALRINVEYCTKVVWDEKRFAIDELCHTQKGGGGSLVWLFLSLAELYIHCSEFGILSLITLWAI